MSKKLENISWYIGIVVSLTILSLTGSHASQFDSNKNTEGIEVHAICESGRLDNTDITIYLLDGPAFIKYRDSGGKIETEAFLFKGISPVNITGIPPGKYCVGAEIIIDADKIPPSGDSNDYRPRPEKYYFDDVPAIWGHGIKMLENNPKALFAPYWIKWYWVSVEENKTSYITPLFLSKKENFNTWDSIYPKTEKFTITTSENQISEFWNSLKNIELVGATISDNNQNLIVNLLKRGGRVVLPEAANPFVIFVSYEGELQATGAIRKLDKSNLAKIDQSFSPNIKVPFLPSSSKQEKKSASKKSPLPLFESKIKGDNQVRIVNPNGFSVDVGIRAKKGGIDFAVSPNSQQSVFVPDGNYDIYFVYSNEPSALYKGENFVLKKNGIEIQIVKVANGNYAINRVK